MAKEKRIGRSIEELLNDPRLNKDLDSFKKVKSSNVINISTSLILDNEERKYNENKVNEIVRLIKESGVINPLVVRHKEGKYQIVSGVSRFQALLRLGYKTVPAILDSNEETLLKEAALIRMIQEDKLNPIEEAKAYIEIQQKTKYKQKELSVLLGKSRSYIANMIRLLTLPKKVQEALEEGKITTGHARTLIGLSESRAESILNKIIDKKINVRDLEKETAKIKNVNKNKKTPRISYRISKGCIEIPYKNKSELNEIVNHLNKKFEPEK